MHARVTTVQVPPDRIDDATRHVREQVLPRLSQMEGFEGMVALASSQSGKVQGVAFWESEEALNATEQAVVPIREGEAERSSAREDQAATTDARGEGRVAAAPVLPLALIHPSA